MSAETDTTIPPAWRQVHLQEYSEPLDLLGRDLISQLGRTKDDISKLVGTMVEKSQMQTEDLPGEQVTSMTGKIADEVHEWPRATLGRDSRHLILQFREGRLNQFSWKTQGGTPTRNTKPW